VLFTLISPGKRRLETLETFDCKYSLAHLQIIKDYTPSDPLTCQDLEDGITFLQGVSRNMAFPAVNEESKPALEFSNKLEELGDSESDMEHGRSDSSQSEPKLGHIGNSEPDSKHGSSAALAGKLHDTLASSMLRLSLEADRAGAASERMHPQLKEQLRTDSSLYESWSQRSTPASSNKPPSLDGKSVMSGATFALDEKESLRPDDSASTRALEDDDTFSGPGSAVAPSRVGSEIGDRAFREQFYKIAPRLEPSSLSQTSKDRLQSLPEQDYAGVIDASDFARIPSAQAEESPEDSTSRFGFFEHGPDEKLLNAMQTPKDRLFLLRLEQDIIGFIKDSSDPTIDLAPSNSYQRLLSHKLADYYCLTHVVDNLSTGIRLFRTPYCRVYVSHF
jgi:hypothetical protein